MTLVSLLVLVVIVGLVLYLIQNTLPMPIVFKQVATVIVVLILIFYLIDYLPHSHIWIK